MYKTVENELELAIFNGIWTTVWREKGFDLEFSELVLAQNIISTENGDYVGTAEIKPYFTDFRSEINKFAPFSEHPCIIATSDKIAEVDKIALLKTYRSKGEHVANILSSIIYSATKLKVNYVVTLLEPVFMRALKVTFKIPMERVGEKTFYKGDYVIPAIIDIGYMIKHIEKFSWYVKPRKRVAQHY